MNAIQANLVGSEIIPFAGQQQQLFPFQQQLLQQQQIQQQLAMDPFLSGVAGSRVGGLVQPWGIGAGTNLLNAGANIFGAGANLPLTPGGNVPTHRMLNALQDAQLKRTLFNILEGSVAHKTKQLQLIRTLLAHPSERVLLQDLANGRPVATERVVDVMLQDRQRDAVVLGLLDELIASHLRMVTGPQAIATRQLADYALWQKDLSALTNVPVVPAVFSAGLY